VTANNGSSGLLMPSLITPYQASTARRIGVCAPLTIYVALLMFIPSDEVWSPLGGAGSPANILAFCLLAWYLCLWLGSSAQLDRGTQPIRFSAVVLGCTVIISYVSANLATLPILERNAADRGLISMAGWLGILLLAADCIDHWDSLHTLLRRILAFATIVASIGIVQFVTGINLATYIVIPGLITKVPLSDLLVRDGFNRPSATAAHPLELAAVLAMCLPFALHEARFATGRARPLRWLQAVVIAVAIPMTISRSAVLGLAAVAVVLIPTWPRRQRRAAYLVILGTVGLLWLAQPHLLTVFLGLFGQVGADPSSTSRLSAYASAVPYIEAHPWFGQGFLTFLPQTYFFVDNQYLSTLIETGVAGLLALVAMFVTGWHAARSSRRLQADPRSRDLMQCLAASVLVAAVSFSTFDAMSFSIAAALTFLLLGCVGAAWRLTRRPSVNSGDGDRRR
jgi:O-antigen ligase